MMEIGDEIAPGGIFYCGFVSRNSEAAECLRCGGFAEQANSTKEEIESELNCGRSWACCCVAFVCKKCGARMVGSREAPEME